MPGALPTTARQPVQFCSLPTTYGPCPLSELLQPPESGALRWSRQLVSGGFSVSQSSSFQAAQLTWLTSIQLCHPSERRYRPTFRPYYSPPPRCRPSHRYRRRYRQFPQLSAQLHSHSVLHPPTCRQRLRSSHCPQPPTFLRTWATALPVAPAAATIHPTTSLAADAAWPETGGPTA